MTYECRACHGLGIIQPIDELARELNAATPVGVHFVTVGGIDPQLEQSKIEMSLATAVQYKHKLIWIGHSKGAMLGYYLPKAHPNWPFKLVITVDPTSWGSNIDAPDWALAPPHPGHWLAAGNVDRWINIHTCQYPGGGVMVNIGKNREDHFFPDADHVGVILDPRAKKIIFDAVLWAVKED